MKLRIQAQYLQPGDIVGSGEGAHMSNEATLALDAMRILANTDIKEWRSKECLQQEFKAIVGSAQPLPQPTPVGCREALEETTELEVDVLPDGRCIPAISDDALWTLTSALHSNVCEADRPMSWSDYSPEQIQRLRQAALVFIAALAATSPVRTER